MTIATTGKLKNQLEKRAKQEVIEPMNVDISSLLAKEKVRDRIIEVLGDKAQQFITGLIQLVNNNKSLMECDPSSVLGSAMTSATLDLSLNPSLGMAYVVPYNCKDKKGNWIKKAQFQIGYRGWLQLCMRTNRYTRITTNEVYEGEIQDYNRFTDEIILGKKTSNKIIGYIAYMKLTNGFEKYWYMTKEEMIIHGKTYSKTFDNDKGLWQTQFNVMAKKTVLKQLLSKFGVISTQIEKALIQDQAIIEVEEVEEVEGSDGKETKEEVIYLDNYQDQDQEEFTYDVEKENIIF